MKTYEILVIYPFQTTGEGHHDPKNVFEEIVKKHEGKVLNRTELGRRLLGYVVKKSKEGHVVSFLVEFPPSQLDALRHSLQLTEEILKFTIVAKTKAELLRHVKPALSQPVQTSDRR